jgi:short-subunit dehydrogenase
VSTGFQDAAGFREEDETAMPRIMWVAAPTVAKAAVDGLDANRSVVIPGLANRVGAYAGWLAPRSVVVPMVAGRHPALSRDT